MNYQVVPLGEVARVERDGIDPARIQSGARYVGLEHIDSSGSVIDQMVQNGELASTKFAFSRDHILYGKLRPYLRKIARPDFAGVCSTDIIPIRPGSRVDRGYLFHFLRMDDVVKKSASLATGVNLPRLNPRPLESFEIPLPPLDEQRRIAAILDQADDLRRIRQEALERLERFVTRIVADAFDKCRTWTDLGSVCDVQGGLQYLVPVRSFHCEFHISGSRTSTVIT